MLRNSAYADDSADRDLERRVVNYLAGRHMPALRHLNVEASGGTVVLRGRVHSFYEKQLCHHCSNRVAGVRQVIDAIEVIPAHAVLAQMA